MRVLGRIRLSRSSEESTSVERQRELIETWAKANNHEIVAWAEDVDVSGAISPFDTPALGPYLREPASNEWDILVAWKLDRLARNSININKLFAWITDNDKTLVSISENIDLSTWVGRMIANVIAGVAEGELEAIKERVTASKKKLRESGRWDGGRIPYGYRPSPIDTGGFTLEKDPETFPVLRRIIQDYINGKPIRVIADELNEEKIPTAQAGISDTRTQWRHGTLGRILNSRALLGWALHEGKPIFNKDGTPVLRCPPAVTMEEWDKIQATLEGRRWAKVAPDRTSPLLGVLECWECGGNMHHKRYRDKPSGSYTCANGCKQPSVNDEQVLGTVNEQFHEILGDYEVLEKKVTRGSDLTQELKEAQDTYTDLSEFITTATTSTARKALFAQLETLENRIKVLEAQEVTEDKVEWIPTGETYREKWDALDLEGRRQLLIGIGVRVRARQLSRGYRNRPGIQEVELIVPEDMKQRLINRP